MRMTNDKVIEKSLVIRVVTLFVKENMTILEIADNLGVSNAKVLEILNNRQMIGLIYLESASKIIRAIHEKLRDYLIVNGNVKDYTPALDLKVFYRTEAEQYVFLRHLALTFRLKSESLGFLFRLNPDLIRQNLDKYNAASIKSLHYLFNTDDTDQEVAISKALNYCQNLYEAIKSHDKEAMISLTHQIDDYYVKLIKKKREENKTSDLTFEEIGMLLNYQIKYNVASGRMGELFNFYYVKYNIQASQYLEDKPELKAKFESILNYYNSNKGKKR